MRALLHVQLAALERDKPHGDPATAAGDSAPTVNGRSGNGMLQSTPGLQTSQYQPTAMPAADQASVT